MALPDNGHHVHSDGYTSDRGEPDMIRMMEDVTDEIESVPGIESVASEEDTDGPYAEVEYDGEYETMDEVESVAEQYECAVISVNSRRGWMEVRPKQ